jgi:DNA-binding transcriptional regulator YiaG
MVLWTPEQVKAARARLGLTQAELADRLRLAPATGKDTVRSWESGKRPITGPAQVAIEFMLRELDAQGRSPTG